MMYSKYSCNPTRSLLSIRQPSSSLSLQIKRFIQGKNFDHCRTAIVAASSSSVDNYYKFPPYRLQMSSSSSSSTSTPNTSTVITKSHYEKHSAESYDSAFFYEVGPYMKHLRDLCHKRLQLDVCDWNRAPNTGTLNAAKNTDIEQQKRRILLDIGGGTGTFTRTLIARDDRSADDDDDDDQPNIEAIVMDPYLEFNSSWNTANNENQNSLHFIKAPAEAFIMKSTSERVATTVPPTLPADESFSKVLPTQYHQILMKEVIHHFSTNDRPAIFHGLYHSGLIPTTNVAPTTTTTTTSTAEATNTSTDTIIPSILIITRPQYEIDYPLWDDARTVWAQNQPSLDVLVQELETVGFTNVTHTIESYPCSIPLSRWCSMIRNRFWSTFTNFTDDELQLACQVIETNEQHRITKEGIIQFEDRLLFITACKL